MNKSTNLAPVSGQDEVHNTDWLDNNTVLVAENQASGPPNPPATLSLAQGAAAPVASSVSSSAGSSLAGDGITAHIHWTDPEHQIGKAVTLPNGEESVAGIEGLTRLNIASDALLNVMPALDDEDGEPIGRDCIIRLGKGQAVKFQVVRFMPAQSHVARHRWPGGQSLVCPALTSPELLKSEESAAILAKTPSAPRIPAETTKPQQTRTCPLCGLLDGYAERYVAVLVHAEKSLGADWRSRPAKFMRILRVNERMWQQLKPAAGEDFKSLLIAGRNVDAFGSYYVEMTQEPAPPIKAEMAQPTMHEVRVEEHETLVELSQTIIKSRGLLPQPGRVVSGGLKMG